MREVRPVVWRTRLEFSAPLPTIFSRVIYGIPLPSLFMSFFKIKICILQGWTNIVIITESQDVGNQCNVFFLFLSLSPFLFPPF